MHLTGESSSGVCIIPRSLTPRCASHHGVNNLSSVCFNLKFYKCYISVMPKDIHTKLILKVTNCPRNLFQAPWFASYHGVGCSIFAYIFFCFEAKQSETESHFRLCFFLLRSEAKQKPFRFLFASFCETKTIIFPFTSNFSLRFTSLFHFLL